MSNPNDYNRNRMVNKVRHLMKRTYGLTLDDIGGIERVEQAFDDGEQSYAFVERIAEKYDLEPIKTSNERIW